MKGRSGKEAFDFPVGACLLISFWRRNCPPETLDPWGRVTALRKSWDEPSRPAARFSRNRRRGQLAARPRATVRVTTNVSADGAPLAAGTGVVNGGPWLLSDGASFEESTGIMDTL